MASLWRNVSWALQGWWYYTKNTMQEKPCLFDPEVLRDVSGKSFMVTGANSGIGKEVALQLAKLPKTTVHLLCRNPDRGEAALKEISSHSHPESSLRLHIVDLSLIQDVQRFSDEFTKEQNELHVLINNAGALLDHLVLTNEGLDSSFALNVVGAYILTENLAPLLRKSSEQCSEKSRVITVSSGGMLTERLNPHDPELKNQSYDGVRNYAQHKRQQVVLTEYWATKYKDIYFASMHPGWVDTPGVEKGLPAFYEKMKSQLRTVTEGADSAVWLSIVKESALPPSGSFVFDRVVSPTHLTLGGTTHTTSDVNDYISKLEEIIRCAIKLSEYTFDGSTKPEK